MQAQTPLPPVSGRCPPHRDPGPTAPLLLSQVGGLGLSAPLPRLGELHSMGIGFAAPASLGPLPLNATNPPPSASVASCNAPLPLPAGAALIDAGLALASIVRSDRPDGLMATIVEEDGGSALGLVFSTAGARGARGTRGAAGHPRSCFVF